MFSKLKADINAALKNDPAARSKAQIFFTMRQRNLLWAIILALSAIVAGARAQRFYLPEDLSFTGSQYVWESRALFELSDPDMWLYCESGYAPALQYLPPFSELRHLLHHPCRSYARWGYQGMIGYRVLTDYGY